MANTPGPWKWDWKPKKPHQPYAQPILYGADGKEVCNFGDGEQYYPTEGTAPSFEDADLMARAPELLAEVARLKDKVGTLTIWGERADAAAIEAMKELEQTKLQVGRYRKYLWLLARDAGLGLHIANKDIALIPDDAELLEWNESLFDAVILKGICKHADCAPGVTNERVVENPKQEGA